MNIILIGLPGSGKGTQAQKIIADFNLAYFSAGDTLRELAREDSSLGRQVNQTMSEGKLVSNQLMAKIIKDFLAKNKGSIIFDGYPRGLDQAYLLEKELTGRDGVGLLIYLEAPEEVLIKRLSSRVICNKCRAVYNLVTNPPKSKETCDICGGRLYQRDDEKRSAVKKRLTVFYQQTKPVIDFFGQKNQLFSVNGDQPIEAIYQIIKDKLISMGLKLECA